MKQQKVKRKALPGFPVNINKKQCIKKKTKRKTNNNNTNVPLSEQQQDLKLHCFKTLCESNDLLGSLLKIQSGFFAFENTIYKTIFYDILHFPHELILIIHEYFNIYHYHLKMSEEHDNDQLKKNYRQWPCQGNL